MSFPMTSTVLDLIAKKLPAKDILRLSMTNKDAYYYLSSTDNIYKKIMEENLWMERKFTTRREDLQFILNNIPIKHSETASFNDKVMEYTVFSNKGSLFATFGNGTYFWLFRDNQEIFYIDFNLERTWRRIVDVSFSPDDNHVMIVGIVNPSLTGFGGREALIYQCGRHVSRVRLAAWIILEVRMLAAWFDNEHVIYLQNDGLANKMRFHISTIAHNWNILVFPILTFNMPVKKLMVAQHVSPRARKVVQIANQAAEEGKTLHEKLIEIGHSIGIDVTDMAALKKILDQNDECMPCYQLHAHHDAVQVSECRCQCHNNTDKLLIFSGSGGVIHAKIITQQMIDRVKVMIEHFSPPDDLNHHRLFSPLHMCNHFDTVDYTFAVGGSFGFNNNEACFSPDHRYLYAISTTNPPAAPEHMKIMPICIDLESMTIKRNPGFKAIPWVVDRYECRITANHFFVSLFTNNEVYIWSTLHQGEPADRINEYVELISCVALHPLLNELVVPTEQHVHVYRSSLDVYETKNVPYVPRFQLRPQEELDNLDFLEDY